MGIDVVQGDTRFSVPAAKAPDFEGVFLQAELQHYWTLRKDAQGGISGIELRGWPGAPCNRDAMARLATFVDQGSFVTLETAWGDDAWRWTFRGGRMTERTVCAGWRAR